MLYWLKFQAMDGTVCTREFATLQEGKRFLRDYQSQIIRIIDGHIALTKTRQKGKVISYVCSLLQQLCHAERF